MRLHRSRLKRAVRIGAIAALITAVLHVPMTVHFIMVGTWSGKARVKLAGPAAAAHGWKVPTPHGKPWPAPTDVTLERRFGRSLMSVARVAPGVTSGHLVHGRLTHRVRSERYGWPFACLKRTQWFWPDNPEWRLDAPWDSGVRLAWGVWLNPLIVGAAVGALVGLPSGLRWVLVERRRRRRGLCTGCGYPMGVSAVCTECGRAVAEEVRR